MKVISIMQPWATLIALGEKEFETRNWATKYRGELAIHASKKIDKIACRSTPIVQTLNKHGIVLSDDLPTGAIIAISQMDDCFEIHEDHSGSATLLGIDGSPVWWIGEGSNEFKFGDYSHGRFAWKLSEIKPIEPISAKGQLQIWNYDL